MRTVSPEELTQLLAAVNRRAPFGDQDYWLIVLAANTGLRVSELHGLNVHDVVWQGRPRPLLVVPKELGKGRKSRAIPLNARAREAVAGLLDFKRRRGFSTADEAPLFVIRTHTRMSVRTIEDHIQQLRQAAGLEGVTPHSFRHYAAYRIMPSWCGGLACISVSIEFGGLTTRHNPGVLSVRPYGRERESIRVDNRLLHAPRDHRAHAYGPSGSVHR